MAPSESSRAVRYHGGEDESTRIPSLGSRKTGRCRRIAQGRTICLRILYFGLCHRVRFDLKACIARKTNQDDLPPRDAARYYVHDIPKLLDSVGLSSAFEQEAGQDAIFRANWATVKDWTEETRYQGRGPRQAEEILTALTAINDPQHGVLQWLRRDW